MPEPTSTTRGWRGLVQRYRWLPYALPLVVYLLAGSLEPTPEKPGGSAIGLSIGYPAYPAIYALKLGLTAIAMFAVRPVYREYPLRVTRWGLLVGIAGAALWIGLCRLRLEERVLDAWGLGAWLGSRSAFNPLKELADRPAWAYGFLAVRLGGLAVIVPVMEEFFLRGFAMRFVQEEKWWEVPFGRLTPLAAIVGTLLPVVTHPLAELLAVAAWFSLVTWLMVRTRSLWDCVLAHAVTNLLLGGYVLATGEWRLL